MHPMSLGASAHTSRTTAGPAEQATAAVIAAVDARGVHEAAHAVRPLPGSTSVAPATMSAPVAGVWRPRLRARSWERDRSLESLARRRNDECHAAREWTGGGSGPRARSRRHPPRPTSWSGSSPHPRTPPRLSTGTSGGSSISSTGRAVTAAAAPERDCTVLWSTPGTTMIPLPAAELANSGPQTAHTCSSAAWALPHVSHIQYS